MNNPFLAFTFGLMGLFIIAVMIWTHPGLSAGEVAMLFTSVGAFTTLVSR